MAALTAERATTGMGPLAYDSKTAYKMKASTTIYAGALVALDTDGFARPATAAASQIAVGICRKTITSGGVAGDTNVEVDTGIYVLDNDGTNAVVQATIGKDVYIVDDHTVSSVATGTSRAGKCVALDLTGATGVHVKIGLGD